jgi:serine phosphatase RsbU (regulator of sigma subunit)
MQLSNLISIGVVENDNSDRNQITRIVNSICLVLAFFALIFGIGSYLLDLNSSLMILSFINFFFQTIPIFLNKIGKHNLARVLVILLSYLIIAAFSIIFGPEVHFQYFLTSTIVTPLILLASTKKVYQYSITALGILIWIGIEIYGILHPPIILLEPIVSNSIRISIDIFVVLTVFAVVAIFSSEKQNFYKKLQSVNSELSSATSKTNASLNYAKKMQNNLLKPNYEVSKLFKNFIVYNQPKDIIGGDTYWMIKKGKYKFLAVIDCTGHGVPGALMTMMVHAALNDISKSSEIKKPSEILTELHNRIFENLNQSAEDRLTQDGCDIAICRFNQDENDFIYAGAGIPLYIVDHATVIKIKSNYRSIGGKLYTNKSVHNTFKDHTLTISPNQTYFLLTDGIEDQLNFKNEAYGSKRLAKTLVKTNQLGAKSASQLIGNDFKEWKGATEQLDDTLLIGIKLNR